MADYQLAHWVYDQRKAKFTDAQIRDYLLKYGYTNDIIDQAMNFIGTNDSSQMKMGNPPFAGGTRIGEDHYDTFAVIALVSIFFFPLLGLPFGILSLKHLKHNGHLQGKAFAICGIIFGSIALLIIVLYIAFLVFALTAGPVPA